MKIKAAFVLLALVAFVGLLQSADAYPAGDRKREAQMKCFRHCKRMHNSDYCRRSCTDRRLTEQDYDEDYVDDANDVDDEDYVEDGLDLVERRLSRAECRRHCKMPPWNGERQTYARLAKLLRCYKICDGRRLSGDDEMEDVGDEPRRLIYGRMKCGDCNKLFEFCHTAECRSAKRRCKAQAC